MPTVDDIRAAYFRALGVVEQARATYEERDDIHQLTIWNIARSVQTVEELTS